jgi:hypothetical protein
MSDIGIGAMGLVLWRLAAHYGWWTIFAYYGVPYLVSTNRTASLCG